MKLDLVFTLIDIADHPAREWYPAAAGMMLNSARQAFSGHDVRIVQLSDRSTGRVAGVDEVYATADTADRDTFMQYRSDLMADWALTTERPTIFCDVDLLWNNAGILDLMRDKYDGGIYHAIHDVTLFSREGMGVQPFNGGLILTQPYQSIFWGTYKQVISSLPNDIKHWWGDQIALGVMMGMPEMGKNMVRKFKSAVAFLPMDLVCPAPKKQPAELFKTSAVHFKGGGKRKPWMPEYYAMLERNWSAQQAAE